MLDKLADKALVWIGSTASIIFHTLFFAAMFALILFSIALENVLLILTTVVSLEAIYLSLLIQRSVNQSKATLAEVAEDIEDVTEDLGEVTEDIGEIQEDIQEFSEDIDEIQKDIDEIQEEDEKEHKPSKQPIVKQLQKLRQHLVAHEHLLVELERQLEEQKNTGKK